MAEERTLELRLVDHRDDPVAARTRDQARLRWQDPDSAAYLARRQTDGTSRKHALRRLKRHLTRRIWKLLRTPSTSPATTITIHCNTPPHARA